MRGLILSLFLSLPAYAAEKATATMSVTATVVSSTETAKNVVVFDTVDKYGTIVIRTYVYQYEG